MGRIGKIKRFRTAMNEKTGELYLAEIKPEKPKKTDENGDKPKKKSGYRCPHCRTGVATVERPMVLKNVFGHKSPAKVCEQCKGITDWELLLDLLPHKKWGLARRMLYDLGLVTEEKQWFPESVGTWEIKFGGISWGKFKEGHRSWANAHRSSIWQERIANAKDRNKLAQECEQKEEI